MQIFIKNRYLKQVKIAIIGVLLLFFPVALSAQQADTDQEDVKVGLVLSGGGAKGFAHIGALKIIEAAGVRIDYIGGTSMGAIIGALYASGYRANELDSIFNSVNFNELIQDFVPRNAKTLYEKEDQERYALSLPFNNFRLKFPTSISRGQNVYNLFSKLLRHVSDVNDFNELPIPFFCIATNIETGTPVLLNKGYLPEAISASGAFPSLFEPVEIDGKVLIDGGVVNNYPIDEVRAMGADIIIGIDVQDDLADRDDLNSATSVLLQINNFRTVNDMKTKSKETDIYIHPNIEDFTVISFGQGREIIDNGEKGALLSKEKLEALAKRQQSPPQVPEKIKGNDSLTIKKLTIEGNERYTRGYIKGKLRVKLGRKVSFDRFQQGISNLAATNNFKGIRYKLKSFEDSEELIVNAREREGNTLLRLGAHYDDLYKSSVLVNVTRKRLIFDDDIASFDLILGDNVRYNFQYYLDKGFYWSFGVNSFFNSFERNIPVDFVEQVAGITISDANRLNIDVADFTSQIYAQTVIREEFAFGLGFEFKNIQYESENVVEGINEDGIFEDSNFFSSYGYLKFDTYDDRYFPRKGLFFDGDFHLYLYSSDFNDQFTQYGIGKAKIGFAAPITRKVAVNITTEGGFTLGSSGVNTFDFILGGYGNDLINNFIPFLGYDFLSFGGDGFVKATGVLDYEFINKNHINFIANFANAGDNIFENGEWFTSPDFTGYAIGYSRETFIGPAEIKYSWSPEDGARFFFNVGFWF